MKVSDNSAKPVDSVRKRGGVPEIGAKESDFPTQLLASTLGCRNKDTLGSGKGEREQAPAGEAKDSDDPSTSLD